MSLSLVTGGAGFIGSHLVDALIARGDAVRVLDNFQTGSLDNLAACRHKIELFFGDLTNLDLLRHVMDGVECVFHYAAPPVWEHSEGETEAAPHTCVTNMMHVLLAARDAEVRRVTYASSCEVYGNASAFPLSESTPPQPVSPIGIAKLSEEESCAAFTQHYGVETVGLRFFNVFGSRQPGASPYAALIPQVLKAMLLGRSPIIPGDGLEALDLLHVSDAVHASLLASAAPRVAGKVFNIARGLSTTPLEVVDTVNHVLATQYAPLHVPSRPRGELHNLADVTRAEIELGFCAGADFEQGIRWCISAYGPWRDELLGLSPRRGLGSSGLGSSAQKN